MPVTGVEPVQDYLPRDFKSRASAYSATPAWPTHRCYYITLLILCQVFFEKFQIIISTFILIYLFVLLDFPFFIYFLSFSSVYCSSSLPCHPSFFHTDIQHKNPSFPYYMRMTGSVFLFYRFLLFYR